ncbi:MAG TPA: M55 family metallopeptidase [Firmicutes bacterium]|nr:peptidase M55 [Bacillota bacterium]HHY98563.1 M55 family metallopeptidase [Bacillota bacterium]
MKVYILSDLEGTAGIINFDDYGEPGARYYELAKSLVTAEVNAAVEGALDAGADEILVLDGHGHGAINPLELHPSAKLLAGRPMTYPFGLDASFDAMVIVGQHSKAGTPGGHLAHTGSFDVKEYTINGISVGELGVNMLFAGYFGVPTVMVSGDDAVCNEALALVPGIEVAAVKKGLNWGAAIHLHPHKARELIREKARLGIQRCRELPIYKINPPYERRIEYYGTMDRPVRVSVNRSDDLLKLLRGE